MKKIYIVFLISICSTFLHSQNYHPMLDSVNHWQYVQNNIVFRMQQSSVAFAPCAYPTFFFSYQEQYTTTDTTINTSIYKKVEVVSDGLPSSCDFGYVREDTAAKKVFFIDNIGNPEVLLYDFSIQVGDSINLQFVSGNGYFYPGYYTVDSIRQVHIPAGFRNLFYLNNHAVAWSSTMPWLESVGCLYNAYYPYLNNSWGNSSFQNCPIYQHSASGFMTCFDHATKVYFDSCAYHEAVTNTCFFVQDTCNYYDVCGAIEDHDASFSFQVFPNPTLGKTTLYLDVTRSANFEVLIFDVSGKSIVRNISIGRMGIGKSEFQLDLSDLANGTYFVQLKSETNSENQKLIIQHP